MTFISAYKSPKLTCSDWIAEAYDVIAPNSVSAPPGVRVALFRSRADRTNAQLKALGVGYIYVNAGQANAGVDFTEKAMIDNCPDLSPLCGGGDWRNWVENHTYTNAEPYHGVRQAVNIINPGNKAAFYITEEGEYGQHNWLRAGIDFGQGVGGNFNITLWNTSPQKRWFDEQMTINTTNAGCVYYGQYDGHFSLFHAFSNNANLIIDGLTGGQNAVNTAMNATGFGNPFYTGNRGATQANGATQGVSTQGGIIKAYATGNDNRAEYVAGHLAHMVIDRLARAHKGWNTRVAFVFWPGYDERVNNNVFSGQRYVRDTPSGGKVARPAPPLWGVPAQVFTHTMAMLFGYDIFNWTEAESYGSNPAVSYPSPAQGGQDLSVTWEGNVGAYAGTVYEYTTGPVAWPPNPKGGMDITPVAIHLSHYLRTHAASLPAYAAIKINSGAYCNTNSSYIWDRYQNEKVWAFVMAQGNNRSLLVMDMNKYGPTRQVTVDLGGTTHTFESQGQFYHASRHTI